MHDIDRTQFGRDQDYAGYPWASEGPALSETQEMELAAELLEISTEEEFENFLGDLISGVAKAAGGVINATTGNALGGLLKGAAKKLLPLAGQALGGFVGGPLGAGLGGTIAGKVASSPEMETDQREWEAARTFVRLAADATRNAAHAPDGEAEDTAHQAVADSAQQHAPALVAPTAPMSAMPPMSPPPSMQSMPPMPAPPSRSQSLATGPVCPVCHTGHHHHHSRAGRWIRRGNQVVLLGI